MPKNEANAEGNSKAKQSKVWEKIK